MTRAQREGAVALAKCRPARTAIMRPLPSSEERTSLLKALVAVASCLALLLVSFNLFAAPPGTRDEIGARLIPAGELCLEGEDCGVAAVIVAAGNRSGQEIYDTFCFACHATGISEAPILGDAASWADRLEKSMDELWQTTLVGLNLMPEKGSCVNCTDDELRAALDYMLEPVLGE